MKSSPFGKFGWELNDYEPYLKSKIMTQFDISTIIKKLQDMSRNARFLISEVEKIARLPQMPKVTKSTLIYISYQMYVT